MKTQICDSFKKDYHLCEELGRGKFGIVYRCISTTTGESYAAKCIDKRQFVHDDNLDSRCLEIEPKLLQNLTPHPNILQIHDLYGSDPESNHLIIITELCDASTLYDKLTLTLFSEQDACSVITQLISALAHCHRHGIAHRDVKPENVMFDFSGRRVKLIDFGSAEWFDSDDGSGGMCGVVGTPYYVAPEVLLGREYDEKIDVWSVGVILYIMLGGVPPFYGDGVEEIFRAVIRGNLRFPTKSFRSVSSEAKDLIRKMLCKDASRRLSADQVLRHPWILSGGINNTSADSGI